MTKPIKLHKTELIQYLLDCEESFARNSTAITEDNIFEQPIRDLSFTKSQIETALGMSKNQLAKQITLLEEQGEYFDRNAQSHYLISYELALKIMRQVGMKTIQERRNTHKYNVPVNILNISKGGVGKTSSAIALAVSAALDVRKDQRVCLIDLDPQGSIAKVICASDHSEKYETYCSLIKEGIELSREERLSPEKQAYFREEMLKLLNDTYIDNLKVIPSTFLNVAIEVTIANGIGRFGVDQAMSVFKDCMITPLSNDFDAFYLDTAPASGMATIAAYYAANHVTLITTGRAQDIYSYEAHYTFLRESIENLMPSDFDGFTTFKTLITRHSNRKDKFARAMEKNVTNVEQIADTYRTIVHENRTYEDASFAHLPVQLLETTRDASYKSAMDELDKLYLEVTNTIEPHLFEGEI